MPPVAEATSDIAVVRFHGRNAANWEKPQQQLASSRFKYNYSRKELAEWVPKVKEMVSRTGKLHIVLNNCFEDQAVNAARDIAELLD